MIFYKINSVKKKKYFGLNHIYYNMTKMYKHCQIKFGFWKVFFKIGKSLQKILNFLMH